MERTIKVKGQGKMAVKPDIIQLIFRVSDTKKTYEEVMEEANSLTKTLKDVLEKLGFQRDDLKTTEFNIQTQYENYQDIKHTWKQKFVGYEFKHGLKIEFDADNELLGKVLYGITHSNVNPQIQLHFTVKDKDAVKNILLEQAVKDSAQKAKLLADASNVVLGNIISIDYSWEEISMVSRPMNMLAGARCMNASLGGSYDMDIEAEDILVEDTVTVVWEIS